MIEKDYQSRITIIMEKEENHQIDTRMTDTMTFEEEVVSIQLVYIQ